MYDAILIHEFQAPGLQVALYNESGLESGPDSCLMGLATFYEQLVCAHPNVTAYATARRGEGGELTRWAKVYIDYTPYRFDCALAHLLAFTARHGIPNTADIRYTPGSHIHIGVWTQPATNGAYGYALDEWADALWRNIT